MTTAFTHWFPAQQVVFGRGTSIELAAALQRLGIARPFVVCSRRAQNGPSFESFVDGLAPHAAMIWNGVQPHAPLNAAIEGAQAARAHAADAIVSYGGGSASDLAKGIAFVCAEGPQIAPYSLRREPGAAAAAKTSTSVKLPIVAIPTTLSGAEVTPGFSLTRDDAYKLIFRDAALAARLVVLDPTLLHGASNPILIGSGMNAIAHCCEAMYSRARTPISSLFATEGLSKLWSGLGRRLNGEDSDDDLALGAYFAAAAIVNARTALHHAICHKLAPLAGISHGEANAAILPHALALNLQQCPAEALAMARAMNLDANVESQAGILHSVTDGLRSLGTRAGLRTRLREFGLQRSQLLDLAQRVFAEPGLAFNPRRIEGAEEIQDLLTRAW